MKNIITTAVCFGLLGATTAALAQSDPIQGLLGCSAIESSSDRLSCYDDLARASAPMATESIDNWSVETETDPLDDSTNVFISNEATGDSSTSAFGDLPYLVLRCYQGEVAALLEWEEYLGSDTIQTTYRIGSEAAITDTWYIGSTNKGAFYSYNEPANIDFINKLVNADSNTFVAQATPYNEGIKTAIFDISGLDGIANQLFEACGE